MINTFFIDCERNRTSLSQLKLLLITKMIINNNINIKYQNEDF